MGGSKPQLWRRINNQVTVGEEGNEELCPCAGATKELVEELATARVRWAGCGAACGGRGHLSHQIPDTVIPAATAHEQMEAHPLRTRLPMPTFALTLNHLRRPQRVARQEGLPARLLGAGVAPP